MRKQIDNSVIRYWSGRKKNSTKRWKRVAFLAKYVEQYRRCKISSYSFKWIKQERWITYNTVAPLLHDHGADWLVLLQFCLLVPAQQIVVFFNPSGELLDKTFTYLFVKPFLTWKGNIQRERDARTLQMKGQWKSYINVWFPFMYSQKWNCYLQYKTEL